MTGDNPYYNPQTQNRFNNPDNSVRDLNHQPIYDTNNITPSPRGNMPNVQTSQIGSMPNYSMAGMGNSVMGGNNVNQGSNANNVNVNPTINIKIDNKNQNNLSVNPSGLNLIQCDYCTKLTGTKERKVCGQASFLWCLFTTLLTAGLILCLGCDMFDRCMDTEIMCIVCSRRKGLVKYPCFGGSN